MKIACLGSAPSSVQLAPLGDPSWLIWACSPGTYYLLPRCDAFFELHRWEPGVIGKPATQKQWFSPEYVAWMGLQKLVWMAQPQPEIPGSRALPFEAMSRRWGTFFWTSSLAYMIAMALDLIIDARQQRAAMGMPQPEQDRLALEDAVGLWGVDMAATEEYGYQRAGCQHFLAEANRLGIKVVVPPESDILRPMPPYGLFESTHFMIKNTARLNELQSREAQTQAQIENLTHSLHFMKGAIDNQKYHMQTWGDDREGLAAHPEVARLQSASIASESPAAEVAKAGGATATVVSIRPAAPIEPSAPVEPSIPSTTIEAEGANTGGAPG